MVFGRDVYKRQGITINLVFSDNGIIKKAQIAKNEVEVSTIKDALELYYLQQYFTTKEDNPIGEQFPSTQITPFAFIMIPCSSIR